MFLDRTFAHRLLRQCLAVLCLALCGAPAAAAPLVVDGTPSLAAWPAVMLLAEPAAGPPLALQQVLARAPSFEPPAGTPGNLGRVPHAVWLRIPLQVPGTDSVRRVLEIDYPSLNRIDVYLLHGGRLLATHHLGNQLPYAERPMPARTHAAPLTLPAGASELLLRVQTQSTAVLPITLRTPENFAAHESEAQLMQGLQTGLALAMLLYSLAHWVSLRERVFLHYALMLGGNAVFFLAYFGIGAQYLWPNSTQLSQHIAPLAVLLAVFGSTGFISTSLAVREVSRATAWLLRAIGVAALLGLGMSLLGLIDYRAAQSLATVLGLLSTGAMLPVMAVRAWRGERVAAYMAVGWAFYALGAVTIAALLRGYLEPTFLAQHLYPVASMIEMATWMAVLGIRVQVIHRNADRARVESETLRALAQSDPLTGLPNRRGLQERLGAALQQCTPQQVLAVFMLDLDGFKSVNDRYGHDVGDALLVAVGQRLQAQLRSSDVVARQGGDEFVVLACGLANEAAAQAVGQTLLGAFNAPFDVAGQRCEVGATIGYALAPRDSRDADELIKRADAAMYAGKQAGRRRVQCITPALARA